MAECKDCLAAGIMTRREAPWPGPRCKSHHLVARALRQEATRQRLRQMRYGITPDQHAAILEVQDGVCAICRRATGRTRALSVDHDHRHPEPDSAQAVRGLLCRPCNDLLGHVRDSQDVLLRAVAYLNHPPAHRVIPREDTTT